jgi:hypothetical protein
MLKTNAIAPPLGASNTASIAANDIRGIKAPVPIPNPWLWVAWFAGIALLAGVAWWLWNKRRKQTPAAQLAPVIPPDERARARLREALNLLDQPRPFCILVSDTIRLYLEERFNLRAPERTTEEFLEELQASALLNYEQKRILGEFLMRCDLVKFARYEPARPELEGIYEVAVRLVEETQAPPPVANPAPAATSEAR